ncbi:cytochrome P450 [Syncephalis fuscata]|nr:cytochrome P450 [Syncephalis fuscata]
MSPAFTPNSLENLEPLLYDIGIARLVQRLYKYTDTESTVDLMDLLKKMKFDVTGEVAFGKTFGLLEEDREQHPVIRWINSRLLMKLIFGQLFFSQFYPKLVQDLASLNNAAIERRRNDKNNTRNDILQQMITSVDEKTGATVPDEGMCAEAILLM